MKRNYFKQFFEIFMSTSFFDDVNEYIICTEFEGV